jgi:hypothetical protein
MGAASSRIDSSGFLLGHASYRTVTNWREHLRIIALIANVLLVLFLIGLHIAELVLVTLEARIASVNVAVNDLCRTHLRRSVTRPTPNIVGESRRGIKPSNPSTR